MATDFFNLPGGHEGEHHPLGNSADNRTPSPLPPDSHDDEIEEALTCEQIMAERSIAYERWGCGKSWIEYRGRNIDLVIVSEDDEVEDDEVEDDEVEDDEVEDDEVGEIVERLEYNGDYYESLDEVLDLIDEEEGDEEDVVEAVQTAWRSLKGN